MALIRTIFDSERENSAFSKLNSLVFQQAGSVLRTPIRRDADSASVQHQSYHNLSQNQRLTWY